MPEAIALTVYQGLSPDQGHPDADHREQPQHRAPVGQQQQHDHHGQRRIQQRAVDPRERIAGIGSVAQWARDVYGEPVTIPVRDRAQLIRRGGRPIPAVLARIDRNDGLDRLPVPGDLRPGDLRVDHAGYLGEGLCVRRRLGLVRGGDPRRPVVDDHRRDDVR